MIGRPANVSPVGCLDATGYSRTFDIVFIFDLIEIYDFSHRIRCHCEDDEPAGGQSFKRQTV